MLNYIWAVLLFTGIAAARPAVPLFVKAVLTDPDLPKLVKFTAGFVGMMAAVFFERLLFAFS